MTVVIPRFIGAVLAGIIIVIQCNICLICHDRSKPLQPGFRKWCLKWVYNIGARSLAYWILFTHYSVEYVTPEEVNYYEEWLGTKEEQEAE